MAHTKNSLEKYIFQKFVLLLLNVPVNGYGHVGMAISDFVGLLPDIKMTDTSSPAFKLRPSKLLSLICRGSLTYHLFCK